MKLKKVLHISRPRFWVYEFATFLFFGVFSGLAVVGKANPDDFPILMILLYSLYFLIPANILIYGVNDIFDYETDLLNPRKVDYESLVTPAESKILWKYIFFSNIPFFLTSFILNLSAMIAFWVFLFFAIFYSAPPVRAKSKPMFDSFFSASHYVMTAVFGYILVTGIYPDTYLVVAGIFWACSMHAYSAVPDISVDKEAKIDTIATLLGGGNTLILCGTFYVFSGIILSYYFFWTAIVSLSIYLLIVIITYLNFLKIDKIYTYFPYVNAFVGMLISLNILVVISKN